MTIKITKQNTSADPSRDKNWWDSLPQGVFITAKTAFGDDILVQKKIEGYCRFNTTVSSDMFVLFVNKPWVNFSNAEVLPSKTKISIEITV